MVKDLADLHVHSTYSDGIYSPTDLVKRAENIGLGGIALTEHDTITGNKEFLNAEITSDIVRIPGVEISTDYNGLEIHLLGYYIPDDPTILESELKKLEESRKQRFPKMVSKLRQLGMEIPEQKVDAVLKNVTSPGRPHLARILIEEGFANSVSDAFTKYLGNGEPGYVRREKMDTQEAITILRNVGATPILAHPLLIKTSNLRDMLIDLKTTGLEGIEVEYNYIQPAIQHGCTDLWAAINNLGFIETGGSDYHGDDSHTELGDVTVPMDIVYELEQISNRIRSSL
ncbi:MAG: PHP domain-containing protein [Candidatus Thorarchaeota archaeon]